MQPGFIDLLILIIIFLGLQAWWIIPIIKRNKKLNDKRRNIKEDIEQLERIYNK